MKSENWTSMPRQPSLYPDFPKGQGDITQIDPNINAGVKYMRWMVDHCFKDESMDRLNKGLFAFASCHAGPATRDGKR